jgi:hypothetical protein
MIPSEYTEAARGDGMAPVLAGRIREFWQRKGHRVDVRLVRINGNLCVRSDMRGGWPR